MYDISPDIVKVASKLCDLCNDNCIDVKTIDVYVSGNEITFRITKI